MILRVVHGIDSILDCEIELFEPLYGCHPDNMAIRGVFDRDSTPVGSLSHTSIYEIIYQPKIATWLNTFFNKSGLGMLNFESMLASHYGANRSAYGSIRRAIIGERNDS